MGEQVTYELVFLGSIAVAAIWDIGRRFTRLQHEEQTEPRLHAAEKRLSALESSDTGKALAQRITALEQLALGLKNNVETINARAQNRSRFGS